MARFNRLASFPENFIPLLLSYEGNPRSVKNGNIYKTCKDLFVLILISIIWSIDDLRNHLQAKFSVEISVWSQHHCSTRSAWNKNSQSSHEWTQHKHAQPSWFTPWARAVKRKETSMAKNTDWGRGPRYPPLDSKVLGERSKGSSRALASVLGDI